MASDSSGKSPWVRAGISLVLVAILLLAGYKGFETLKALRKQSARTGGTPPRTVVRVEPVVRTTYRETLSGYGRARALRQSVVDAEVAGVIRKIAERLEAGGRVAADAELIRLDDREYRAAVARAKATLEQAEAGAKRHVATLESVEKQLEVTRGELETSRRELARLRDEARAGHASQSEYDQQHLRTSVIERSVLSLTERIATTKADQRRSQAEIAAANAALERAELDLERTVIRAPYAGEILRRHANLGSRVAPGEPLFEIVDTSRVEVPISLPAARFGQVRVGATASIRLSESGPDVWRGVVARVSPGVDPEQRTFRCFLVVEAEGDSPVPPGAFVVGRTDGLFTEDVIVLPRAAFVGDVVYVAERGEGDVCVARLRRPKVLRLLSSVALVESGVEVGEEVLVTSVEEVGDGTKVRVVRTAEETDMGRDGDR